MTEAREGEAAAPRYTWSDAWVLAAVTVGGGDHGAGLQAIIEAGDLINRAIFTPQELRRGLAKLLHDGHVRRQDDVFVVTGRAMSTAVVLAKRSPSSYDLLQTFEDFLEAEPYPAGSPGEEDPHWTLPDLTDEKIALACAAYRKEHSELKRDASGGDRA